jgi:hypothetical protein
MEYRLHEVVPGRSLILGLPATANLRLVIQQHFCDSYPGRNALHATPNLPSAFILAGNDDVVAQSYLRKALPAEMQLNCFPFSQNYMLN